MRLVADEQSVLVGIDRGDTTQKGELVVIDPSDGSITSRTVLPLRPEGIALTPRYIWTSGAVLDRDTLAVSSQSFGFSVTRADDGSIWTTSGVPSSATAAGVARRFAPGDFAG